jgi:hypothetical protein
MNSVCSIARKLVDSEFEQQRARVNHDLLKNDLLLCLLSVQAVLLGDVTTSRSLDELFDEVHVRWHAVESAVRLLIDRHVIEGMVAELRTLPFIRQLDTDELPALRRLLQREPEASEGQQAIQRLTLTLEVARVRIDALCTGPRSSAPVTRDALEGAIAAIRSISIALQQLRPLSPSRR